MQTVTRIEIHRALRSAVLSTNNPSDLFLLLAEILAPVHCEGRMCESYSFGCSCHCDDCQYQEVMAGM